MVFINTIETRNNTVVELSNDSGIFKTKVFPDTIAAVEFIDWLCAFYDALECEYVVEDAFINEEDMWVVA